MEEIKRRISFKGVGFWSCFNSEICIIGTKGRPNGCQRQFLRTAMEELWNLEKTTEISERIAKQCGDVPRIDLFVREKVEGWDCLGDVTDGKDIREAILEV